MWPWQRAAEAERHAEEAKESREAVDRLAAQSRIVTDRYREAVRLNGFTEMLQQAMGRKEA